MSPLATHIDEEGVYIDNFKLVDRGKLPREAELIALLTGHEVPRRNPLQNVADLKAQIAANEKGVRELRKMIAHFGLPVVEAYMGHVQDNAAEACAACSTGCRFRLRIRDGHRADHQGQDHRRQARSAKRPWISPAPRRSMNNNFNAPEPVTRAAVLYVFRVMVDDNIPMNAGCLRPINIVVPEGSMLKPAYPAAVVAGNVETSQARDERLFGALGAMACSQGTMNNLTFGNHKYQYYETICSGSPAGPRLQRHRRACMCT
jgi:5-oxoprolinase (ATP-hydrolysing)